MKQYGFFWVSFIEQMCYFELNKKDYWLDTQLVGKEYFLNNIMKGTLIFTFKLPEKSLFELKQILSEYSFVLEPERISICQRSQVFVIDQPLMTKPAIK
jgi:hypothetical protein